MHICQGGGCFGSATVHMHWQMQSIMSRAGTSDPFPCWSSVCTRLTIVPKYTRSPHALRIEGVESLLVIQYLLKSDSIPSMQLSSPLYMYITAIVTLLPSHVVYTIPFVQLSNPLYIRFCSKVHKLICWVFFVIEYLNFNADR